MRNRYVLLADLAACAVAVCGAFALRFDLFFLKTRPEFLPYVIAAPLIKPLVFYAFGMYRRFWRYASVNDLLALCFANTAASSAMAICVALGIYRGLIAEFSRSVLIADWLMCLALTAAVRLSIRVIGETQRPARDRRQPQKNVLIIGAGDAGIIVAREMQRNAQLGMRVAGFLDDDPVKLGKSIYGTRVCGSTTDLRGAIQAFGIGEVVIAMPKAPGSAVRRIAEECRQAGIVSRTIPGVFELLDGQVSVSRLRQVDIVDLLRRPTIDAGPDVSHYVRGRDVLVTGAGGSIGFELCRQLAYSRPRRLILLGHGENSIFEAAAQLREDFPDVALDSVIADIRDRDRLLRLFERFRPEIVFHAAAHKHVPLMQDNPEEAISNNVIGTQNVLDGALRVGCGRFVLISTDKAVTPTSVMGASKRVAEALVRDAGRRAQRPFVVVRFGNVLGSRGSAVPTFKKQIEAGGPISITHPDMKRFFMTIPEAVHLVLQAGGIGRGGELFVLKMGEPLRIVQLVEDLIRLSGLTTDDIPIIFTGLRPGEKLEEALWEEGALIQETEHPEVLRVSESECSDLALLPMRVDALAAAAAAGDVRALESILSDLIPSSLIQKGTDISYAG
jgi:FlaA1/EpsC-like NDP-sugar epimerase